MPNTNQNVSVQDIMHYESDIWAIADDLIAVSIKQSDFPAYMMPFFALVMLEGRMLNAVKRVKDEEGLDPVTNPEDFKEAFLEKRCGYNDYIVMQGKTLKSICSNDTTFEQDFLNYIEAFDPELKKLLGVGCGSSEEKYLNMDGISAELRGKHILMSVVSKWANIDLSMYDNSSITTLEEHIKRKWADISASTAGEQYTPDDIISLIAEIVAAKINKPKNKFIHIYDPTCGGANLLFGAADRLKDAGFKFIGTYGSEYNSALYALAAIESRFRDDSKISYGNTLTKVPFSDRKFDVIVANPPYGTKWSGYEKEVKGDQLGQFEGGLPAVTDGQLLFMQHILWQLEADGLAVEVHNGSTLFSGEAGSGESNIRKFIFDHDWVEAIIQMPQQEFFNTGIYTYLWIMNKNKSEEHRNKVALIDGSSLWKPLKKSKGNKRREMSPEHRKQIVDALINYTSSNICKIFDKEHFYYNKQSIVLTEIDDEGNHVEEPINITPMSIQIGEKLIENLTDLSKEEGAILLAELKSIDISEESLVITSDSNIVYSNNPDKNTIVESIGTLTQEIGCGTFVFSLGTKNGLKSVKVAIEPLYTNDYEIIPHHLYDEEANSAEIKAFMDKYIYKPYSLKGNIVGIEANFNKEFYVPEQLESPSEILKDIDVLRESINSIVL